MKKIISLFENLKLWQILLIIIFLSEIITSVMSILLRGRITDDYLITGGVVSLIVGIVAIYLVNSIREARMTNKELIKEITERRQMAGALKESEERFHKVAQHATNAIISANHYGNIISWNAAAKGIFGYSEEEVIREPITLIMPERFHEPHEKGMERLIGGGEPKILGKTIEVFGLRKDGSEFPIELSLSSFISDKGIIFTAIIRDITERKVAEEALRESEEKYRALVESSTDGVVVHQQGKIVYVNTAAWKMLGYESAKGSIGKSALDFVHPDCHDIVKARVKTILETGKPSSPMEQKFLHKGDSAVDVEVFGVLITYKGEPAIQVVFRDITGRKRTEKALERNYHIQNVINKVLQVSLEPVPLTQQLEQVLDLMLSIPWLVLEKKGSISLVKEKPDVLEMVAQRGLHESLLSVCDKVPFGRCICGRAAASKEILFVDRVDERHDNTYDGIKPHGHYCVPILSGKRVLGVLNLYVKEGYKWNKYEAEFLNTVANTLAGIIERKKAEEELEETHEKLEKTYAKMEETHEALQKAYEELKDVDRIKNDIISNVSHELRTPITIVEGALEMSRGEEDTAMRNKLYEIAMDALIKQNRIVGNLVEMAQFRKHKFKFNIEEVKLDHVVSLAVREVKHDAEGKEIKIETDIPDISVNVDFEGIKLVLLNLLDNAIKFTDFGEYIKVSADVKGNTAAVCVEDTGMGVPEELHEKIFDKFFQVDATTTRRFAGTGMGLAVSKEIVEAHGGKIWVKSRKKGSKLCFTLPVSKKG